MLLLHTEVHGVTPPTHGMQPESQPALAMTGHNASMPPCNPIKPYWVGATHPMESTKLGVSPDWYTVLQLKCVFNCNGDVHINLILSSRLGTCSVQCTD